MCFNDLFLWTYLHRSLNDHNDVQFIQERTLTTILNGDRARQHNMLTIKIGKSENDTENRV